MMFCHFEEILKWKLKLNKKFGGWTIQHVGQWSERLIIN